MAGSSSKMNKVTGISSVICSDSTEINGIQKPVRKGVLVFNEDTRELKLSDGVIPPAALRDHRHPFTHAPLVHSHMHGANEPWLMSNPRLWYANDVPNHPELIALDGSDISDDRAEFLSQIYPGVRLVTTPLATLTNNGFENDDIILNVDNFKGDYNGGRLCGNLLDISSFATITDQWLTSDSSLTTEHTVTLEFKGGYSYRPTQYLVCPAAGTSENVFQRRPTPKAWALEGTNDDITWDILDSHSDEPDNSWAPCAMRVFDVSTLNTYKKIRLRISEWNPGYSPDLETGLRRFYLFGRKNGVFSLPDVPAPHADFVWVVPCRNLNVGLKHEDIGDINYTAILPEHLPSYRILADGRELPKAALENELLFATIGHRFDKISFLSNFSASEGTISNVGTWNAGFTDIHNPSFIEADFASAMVGGYKLYLGDYRCPKTWTVEGWNGSAWVLLQSITDMTQELFMSINGQFWIDTTVEDLSLEKIRFNFLEWNEDDISDIGIQMVEIYTHPVGKFYIPSVPPQGDSVAYIVRNNTVVDISPSIIQRLQSNVAALSTAYADLSNRVDSIDPTIDQPAG